MKRLLPLLLLVAGMLATGSAQAQSGARNGAVAIDLRQSYDIWPSDVHL